MLDKKKIIKEYKESVQPMGIFQIRNLQNGKIYVGSSYNLRATANRFNFDPGIMCSAVSQLKNDLLQSGAGNFVFEIVDELEADKDPDYDYTDDLAELERMWIDKLQPFDNMGYNIRKN